MPNDNVFDLEDFLANLPHQPGVYQMLDKHNKVLYVGKACNLKKRVSSYFQRSETAHTKQAMIAKIQSIEITITHTETEALILECNLIKSLQPRYNVLLKDGRGYPYIYLSSHEQYPKLSLHYGAKKQAGRYFGPYPNAQAVRSSLLLIQQLFQLRQCDDSFFKHRTRPCLQHQIKRCSGACVNVISEQDYRHDVDDAILFLEGKNPQLINEFVKRMEHCSEQQQYEQAAIYRDQIINLRRIQERQYIDGEKGDLDIIAGCYQAGLACIQVFFIRAGRNLGNKAFYPKLPDNINNPDILTSFIVQYYSNKPIPKEILVNHEIIDHQLVETMLSEQAQHKVSIRHKVRAERQRWLTLAINNAQHAIKSKLSSKANIQHRLQALSEFLNMDDISRMECFDISHTMGESTVASCVVFNQDGPLKSDYRSFNIKQDTQGDDYAALHEAITRRYKRLKKGEGKLPDILFIDGGQNQTNVAKKVLATLGIEHVKIIGISKGSDRKAGLEKLFLPEYNNFIILPSDSSALHLIQQIRDEAHRFAITKHRKSRAKKRKMSVLEDIPGMGVKRRQLLLKQFGGLQEITRAGIEDIANVPGISKMLAQKIYDQFHSE